MNNQSDLFGAEGSKEHNRRVKVLRDKGVSKTKKTVLSPGKKAVPSSESATSWLPHFSYAIILVMVAMVLGWHFNKESIVRQLDVSGNLFTETREIIEAMAIHEGARVDSLNFLEIMENVERLPYVKQAYINRSPSGDIWVRVREREPVALLIESNRRTYVDAEGIRMPLEPGKSVDVPLLYATSAGMDADTLKGQAFATVNRFLDAARQNKPAQVTISEIAWSDVEGVVALSHDNGFRLIFGSDNFEKRLNKWMVFYTDKVLAEGIKQLESIDLRFDGQIVTR